MKEIILIDKNRPAFFRDKHFTLNEEQISSIKCNIVKAMRSGVDVEVYKAFHLPENKHLLKILKP